MNTLIVYDSTFGNTRQLALKMAEVFQEYGYVHPIPVAEASHINETDWDLLLIGGPTQLHKVSPAMNTLVRSIPRRALRGRYAAAFDTRYQQARWLTGSAARRLARRLRRSGARLLLPAESFFVTAREGPLVEGEAQRATIWARILVDCFQREEQQKQSSAPSALV